MRVRIRLQDHGVKNHRFWWIVVQPANKNPHGRYLERIGFWLPRKTATVQRAMILNKHRVQYWLGMGATCTNRVHRILEKFNYVPKMPPPFGSHTLYEKPEKKYDMSYYKKAGPKGNNAELYLRQQMQEQMIILERRQRLQQEALANLGIDGGAAAAIPSLEEVKTEEIDSEEVDIFERRTKFDELQRRMEKHRREKAHLRGNDLRYNLYMRKMQKLTRKDLGLDMEAYKDYINNLRQFAHINKDFELLARDSMAVDHPEYRQLVEISFKPNGIIENPKDIGLYNERCKELYNVLRKLRREAAGFLNARDKLLIEDFAKNPKPYLMHVDIFEMGKAMLDKRNKEQKIAELTNNGLLDLSKVKPTHLEDAGISLRDFDLITLVAKVDAELFRPSELGSFSPFSMIVDVGKYQDRTDIPWEFKELIYRPPKLKSLYEKYWTLARLVEGKTKVEHDREILTGYKPRYPKKTPEEQQIVNKVIETIQRAIDQDKVVMEREDYLAQLAASNAQLQSELQENPSEDSIYYPGAVEDALRKHRRLSKQEREALKTKGDDVDAIPTSDLDRDSMDSEGDEEIREIDYGYFTRNRINLARMFYGKDGGYTIRKLKKFYKNESEVEALQKEEEQKLYEKRKAEAKAVEDGTAVPDEEAEGAEAPEVEYLAADYSDESDIDEVLNNIDDEQWEKICEELEAQHFNTEEEAKAYFEARLKDVKLKLVKPLKKEKDEREETDPYWAMLKEDKVITSRFQDEFDMEKDDAHAYMDKVEQNIARYPVGFRHYENFDNYRTVYPDATIQDYFEVMNKQVEFDEYKEIMKAAFLEECKNPYFNWKNNYPDWEYVDQNEILTPDNFVASEFYDMEMRKEYAKTVKTYLLNKEWYSLVECLEDVCNFWSYGRNFATMPTYNTFMPTKTHLMDKPDMFDAENDDLGYRFNAQSLSSSGYLSTLKGFKMLPKALKKPIVDMNKPKFNKYRRLSNSKMNAFSTTVNQQSAAFTPKTQPPTTFLSSIFSSAGPFGTEKQNGWLFYRK